MKTSEVYKRIIAEVEGIALLDTHEHLISEQTRLGQEIDLFYWFSHYSSSDLVSAGMPEQTLEAVRDPGQPLDERWALFAPFWKYVRTTAYGRALLLAARDLFDVLDINEATYQELSAKIAGSNHEGWYHYVLQERANIALAVLHPLDDLDPTPLEEIDRSLFAPVIPMGEYITPCNLIELRALAQKTDLSIHSIDDLLSAVDVAFEQGVAAGAVGVKVGVAYSRSLDFEKVVKSDAERVFNHFHRYPVAYGEVTQLPPVSWSEAKPLHDYLMHEVVRRAIEYDLPIQIHTGLQEGTGNYLANANPLHLSNLLVEYREARFDLFHAGYPYQGELAALVKNFANAYADLCWVHVISPWVARQTLHEWIETLPANKIFAFGGDYIFVEGTYAHARLARENVAQVLTEKVAAHYLSEAEALTMARQLLHDNAVQFFRLGE
ncbi:amidohydrolase family protein [Chloroflexota bacterium]